MNRLGNHHPTVLVFLVGPNRHQHGFSQATGAVVDRRVGNIHTSQRGHHGLVLVDELECALTGFGLIRRIGGHEFASGGEIPYR